MNTRVRIPLAFALGLLAPTIAASQQTSPASLTITPPAGWNRADDPARGITAYAPPGLPRGAVCMVTILPTQPFAGTAEELHATVVGLATKNVRLMEPPQRGAVGGFLKSTARQQTPQGVVRTTIYTARWADRGEAVVFATNNEALAQQYLPAVEDMIGRVEVPASNATATAPSSGAPPASGIEFRAAAVPSADHAVPIVGSYISAASRTSYSVGTGVTSKVDAVMLVLYANGVAARASVMKDGSIDANYLAEGFATLDPTDASKLGMRLAGRWKEQSGNVSVSWATGEKVDLTRDGDNLKERYVTWTPYRSVDGLRLDGRFQRVVPFGPPWAITLRKDGTFSEDGVNETMGGTIVNPAFPEHGSGTYEIRRWSLILRFGNGFVQSINLLLGDGEPTNTSTIVLNGNAFTRTGR